MLNQILPLVFAGLAAVFALLAMRSVRQCSLTLTEMRETVSRIVSLRGKVEAHDSELDAVTDAIAKLRGKFYAERRKSQPTSSSSDYPEDATGATTVDVASLKAHLRRKAGLTAGQPAPHQ